MGGSSTRVLIVGGGIFGVTAALELRARGWEVVLVDAGDLPDPRAASTDISKACRMEYGSDELLMACMERARDGWLAWNERWIRERGEALYIETGVLMLRRGRLEPGGFEYESWRLLRERGHLPERLNAAQTARRFQAWGASGFEDGFYHAKGGFARSGRVVEQLARELRKLDVRIEERRPIRSLLHRSGRIAGAVDQAGATLDADAVVVAAGSWTHELVPALRGPLAASGHAVFHLVPRRPDLFRAECFPVFTADIARTGFYGFPLNEGVVKIALHDSGVPLGTERDSGASGVGVSAEHEVRLRTFLAETFPDLIDAELVATRLCPYSDTQDEDFWIAQDPDCPGLVLAAGGSGHAFKFAPLLGAWIADALEGRSNEITERTRWRAELRLEQGREQARSHD